MNFCPSCGGVVTHTVTIPDEKAPHAFYVCNRCRMCWLEYYLESDNKILGIFPVGEDPIQEE